MASRFLALVMVPTSIVLAVVFVMSGDAGTAAVWGFSAGVWSVRLVLMVMFEDP